MMLTNPTHRFERSHDILIRANAERVLNYVSNPNSWPQWLAASHHIESPDRPLVKGDSFTEKWQTRTGSAELCWQVTDSAVGQFWVGETQTSFIGTIVVRYDVQAVGNETRFTRTLINPARPKPITQKMIDAIDQEAKVALQNIKQQTEA